MKEDHPIFEYSQMTDNIFIGTNMCCQMHGHGRSPTLVAAYFISQGGSIEEALEKIKQKRPEIHLEETQLQALKTFQQKRVPS